MNSREEELYEALLKVGQSPEETQAPPPKNRENRSGTAPFSRKNAFIHHDAHPLLLDLLLLRAFGAEWLAWESETLWAEIQRVFKQPPLPVHNKNKIQAVRTAHVVESPWEDWETFVVVSQALNNNIPNFQVLHKPTPPQIMNTVKILSRIRDVEFSPEVQKFIAACFLDESIYYLPEPVEFAQDEAAMLRYRCTHCGNIDRDDENDHCDSCGAPESALRKEPKFDIKPIANRYRQILAQGEDRDELQETVEDIQVAKLLVARDYLAHRDEQLAAQTRELENGRA